METYMSNQNEQVPTEDIRLPVPEKLAPTKSNDVPMSAADQGEAQKNTKEGIDEAQKHQKWRPVLLLIIILVVALGAYAYLHRNNYPEIYQPPVHQDIDRHLNKTDDNTNAPKE